MTSPLFITSGFVVREDAIVSVQRMYWEDVIENKQVQITLNNGHTLTMRGTDAEEFLALFSPDTWDARDEALSVRDEALSAHQDGDNLTVQAFPSKTIPPASDEGERC